MQNFIKNMVSNKFALNSVNLDDLLIEIDDETRHKLQATIKNIFLDIKCVCEKYDLGVFLVGGSALGAVRHQGFIPWDDDLDVGMIRCDYEKFKEVFKNELGSKYILNAPNYSGKAKERFAKVMKRGTVFQEIIDVDDLERCGVFVDIFVLDNVPDDFILRKIKGYCCNCLEFIAGQVRLVECMDDKLKKMLKRTGMVNYIIKFMIGKMFSFRKSYKWFNTIDKAVRYNDESTRFLTIATGRKHYFGEMLIRKELFPLKTNVFEGAKVSVFHNEDYYLSNLYGDYMKIPPKDKREKHFVKQIKLLGE